MEKPAILNEKSDNRNVTLLPGSFAGYNNGVFPKCVFFRAGGLGRGNYSVTEVIDDERFASGLNVGPKWGYQLSHHVSISERYLFILYFLCLWR